MNRAAKVFSLASFLLVALSLQAHGGRTDSLGCHNNRKTGGYHCHSGPLAGQSFSSKTEALKALDKLQSGKSSQQASSTASASPAAKTIPAAEASNHIGEIATVCGKVVTTRYAASSRGGPTFLNLDKPYPEQVFTVVIWGDDRTKFGRPEDDYRGKAICATGKIETYRGSPQIVASDPGQLKIQPEKTP